MNIRRAVPADAEAIAALHASSWRLTYKGALSEEYLEQMALSDRQAVWSRRFASPKANQYVVVAERDAGLVGFACAFAGEHTEWGSYLDNLHINKSTQGQGVGAVLLANVAQWCEVQSPGRGLYLSVTQDNQAAQRFYSRLGAHNAKSGVWYAPDGTSVPTYWFWWESVGSLATQAANRVRAGFSPTLPAHRAGPQWAVHEQDANGPSGVALRLHP